MASVDCPFWASFHCAFLMEQITCVLLVILSQFTMIGKRDVHHNHHHPFLQYHHHHHHHHHHTIIIIIIIIVIIIIITTTILIINKLMVVFFYLAFILSLNKLSGAVDLATGFTA